MSIVNNTNVTISRPTAGTFVKGRPVPGTPTAIPAFPANVQPADGEDLLLLPEGEREKDVQEIFSFTELMNDDLITVVSTGIVYQAQKVLNWTRSSIGYWSALMVSVE